MIRPPVFTDVLAARSVVGRHLRRGIALYVEHARTRAEGAAVAALAGALKLRGHLAGRTLAVVLSGGNVTVGQLRRALVP